MKTQTIEMEFDPDMDGAGKETKNTIMYEAVEEGQPSPIKNVYVQKWLFEEDPPRKIEITTGEA